MTDILFQRGSRTVACLIDKHHTEFLYSGLRELECNFHCCTRLRIAGGTYLAVHTDRIGQLSGQRFPGICQRRDFERKRTVEASRFEMRGQRLCFRRSIICSSGRKDKQTHIFVVIIERHNLRGLCRVHINLIDGRLTVIVQGVVELTGLRVNRSRRLVLRC